MEAGRIVITLLTIALAVTTWYSMLRYKRQFPIAMWLTSIVLILNIADIVFTQDGWAIINAILMVVCLAALYVEKTLREKNEEIVRADAEAYGVEDAAQISLLYGMILREKKEEIDRADAETHEVED